MSFHDPYRGLKLTLLLATLLHLALIIAAGGIAINLLLSGFSYVVATNIRIDGTGQLLQLIVPFYLCLLFSLPQVALLCHLLKCAPSHKRMAVLLGASTCILCFLTLLGAALLTAGDVIQYPRLRDACARQRAQGRANKDVKGLYYTCEFAKDAKQYADRTYALIALAWLAVAVAAGMLALVAVVGWRFRKAGVKMEADSHAVERGHGEHAGTTTTANNLAAGASTTRSAEGEAQPCAMHAGSSSHGSTVYHDAGAASVNKHASLSSAHRKPAPDAVAAVAVTNADTPAPAAAAGEGEAASAPASQHLHTHTHVKHAESAAGGQAPLAADAHADADASPHHAVELPAYTVDAPTHHGS
ncbi:hypothetical protein FA09DRAFT_100452 [Tilletiopsis washingtonensis]|uniref:Uncharacterized protein n=1 Tax=Tilletiopsis washingtonensis TaxID=58919 RepID=A0A316Z412_9BASI|nr:hypothetical protein FA09DRAFT_100452 [Tilletiopsis washingtonensis]PWN96329.1 hypothetical protein FA09DRAFT_100452 [Tilletiopsis washingtonensis]